MITDNDKIRIAFDARSAERPDLADAAERIEKIMYSTRHSARGSLLKMYETEHLVVFENPNKGKGEPCMPEPNILIISKKKLTENVEG